jgi:hypothetical protein
MARRSSKDHGTLFEGHSRLVFATNRANVLPVLSSGLVRPLEAYDKYYDDLLAYCPGLIPLWPNGVPSSIVPLLSSGEPGMFPVLLELDPKLMMSQPQSSLSLDCKVMGPEATPSSDNVLCHLMRSPIPFAAIKCLHFSSQDHMEDFEARDFDNVLALPPLQLTPAAFVTGGPDSAQISAALRAMTVPAAVAGEFRRLDAAMGAVAMLSLLLPSSKSWLDALAATVSYPQSEQPHQATFPAWVGTLVALIMSPELPNEPGRSVDLRLLHAAIELLRSASPKDGWVEARIVAALASRASVGANPTETKEIDSWRDVVTSIARNEKPAGSLDDSGSIVRRALLLLVLRCTPHRIALASDTPLHPGPQVTAVAGMLSGLFHGYSRLSRDHKTRACSPDVLSRLAMCWWSRIDGVSRKVAVNRSDERDDPTTTRIAITVDRAVLMEKTLRPDDAMMRLFYHAKSVGFLFDYDPATESFHFTARGESGTPRRIIIESSRATPRGQRTIRIRTVCVAADGKPIRPSKREDAIALLERNHDPATQCRFAAEPKSGNVEVLVHQILETMDSPELQAHIDAVVRTADEFEVAWAGRVVAEPSRSSRAKAQRTATDINGA